jgi:hypothetical protein
MEHIFFSIFFLLLLTHNVKICYNQTKLYGAVYTYSFVTPHVTNSIIMVISVLILHQIPWLIHFQANQKNFKRILI